MKVTVASSAAVVLRVIVNGRSDTSVPPSVHGRSTFATSTTFAAVFVAFPDVASVLTGSVRTNADASAYADLRFAMVTASRLFSSCDVKIGILIATKTPGDRYLLLLKQLNSARPSAANSLVFLRTVVLLYSTFFDFGCFFAF